MPTPSWKTYGGINKLEKINNISVNSIVTDNFTLKRAYFGNFDICGTLLVSDNLIVQGEGDISGNAYLKSGLHVAKDSSMNGNLVIGRNLKVNGNVTELLNDFIVDGSANIQNELFLGQSKDMYFFGTGTGVGLNTKTPEATLDISGTDINSLNVYSSQLTNTNILARNMNLHGLLVETDDTSTKIKMYNDTAIGSSTLPDAQIQYSIGGNLYIDVTRDTSIRSNVIITSRPKYGNAHIRGETTAIYDISAGRYLPKQYGNINAQYSTGSALALVADNSNSNTFLNICTPGNKGLQIGGGAFIGNSIPKSMGTLGLTDMSGNYVPTQTIVYGNSVSTYLKTTMGVNTYAPKTDKYILDINGPVHIENGEITNTLSLDFKLLSVDRSRFSADPNIFVSMMSGKWATEFNLTDVSYVQTLGNVYIPTFENPTSIYTNATTGDLSGTVLHEYIIPVSINGGKTWDPRILTRDFGTCVSDISINAVYVYNENLTIIGGDKGTLFFTKNNGSSWNKITGTNISTNINAIFIADRFTEINNEKIIYCICDNIINKGQIVDINSINTFNNTFSPIDYSGQYTKINSISGYDGTYYFLVGSSKTSPSSGKITMYTNANPQVNIMVSHENPGRVYNFIYTYLIKDPSNNNNIVDPGLSIAVGQGVIVAIRNATTTSSQTTVSSMYSGSSKNFRNVYIQDMNNAIAVGDAAAIYYTTDGAYTWNPVSPTMLNSSGLSSTLTDPDNNFIGVYMTDINSVVITSVSGSTNKSNVYYCHLPNLFNHAGNTVLDICGNMKISGDITVDDNAYITKSLNVAYDTSLTGNLFLGLDASMGSNVYINKKLTVNYDASLNGNLWLGLDASFNRNVFINKKLVTNYDASLNGNLWLGLDASMGSNVYIKKTLTVDYDASLNANLWIGKDVSLNGNLWVLQDASFNRNVFINKTLVTNYDASLNGNLWLGLDASMGANVYIKKTLTVDYDASLNANLWIGKDVSLNGNLWVFQDASFNRNVFINKKLIVDYDASLNANLWIGKDVSLNGNLWVLQDASFNRNVFINKKLVVDYDASLNANLWIGKDVSLNGNLWVNTDASFNRNVFINKKLIVDYDASLNANLWIGKDVSLNGNLWVNTDASFNRNVFIGGNLVTNYDVSMNRYLRVEKDIRTNETVYTDYILPNTSYIGTGIVNLNIGQSTGEGKTTKIILGNGNDSVVIGGDLNVTGTTVYSGGFVNSTNLMQFQYDADLYIKGISKDCGFQIRDYEKTEQYIVGGPKVTFSITGQSSTYVIPQITASYTIGANSGTFTIPTRSITFTPTFYCSYYKADANTPAEFILLNRTGYFVIPAITNTVTIDSTTYTYTIGREDGTYIIPTRQESINGSNVYTTTQIVDSYTIQNVTNLFNGTTYTYTIPNTTGQYTIPSSTGTLNLNIDKFNDAQGFQQISSDLTGYNFKSTVAGNVNVGVNIVNFNTHSMRLDGRNDFLPADSGIDGKGHYGLMVIKKTSSEEKTRLASMHGTTDYMITSYSLDVSNIMLIDYSVSNANKQGIVTSVDISGNLTIRNSDDSTVNQTGTLQVNGGGSISGNTFIGGNLVVTNTKQSTDILGTTLSGALQISGGASIRGNTFIGGILHTDSPVIVNRPSQSIYPNALMDVSGNAIITRLGLNLSGSAFTNIDSDAILHINGNMVHNNGFIRQF